LWRKVRREAVVDTNAVIYYVVEDSPMHVEAEALLDGLDVWHMPDARWARSAKDARPIIGR